MQMSKQFTQALDAVSTMEPRIPPFFRIGQLVAAYDDADQGILISYGKIERMEWDGSTNTWFYNVRTTPHGTLIMQPSRHIREVRPSEARQNLVLIRNPLDWL